MTWKYVATGGEFIPGVPARDLTDAEAKEYGVEDSALYEKAPPKGRRNESAPKPAGDN